MVKYEICIAGCGPGGLAAALLLHRDGHRVTVFERFDVPQPVGSGLMLQPTGLAVLDRLGLGERARAQGARIDRLFGHSASSGRTVLDVGYRALRTPGLYGVGIHRATLFALLFDAVVDAGIVVETGRAIAGSTTDTGGRRRLAFENGTEAGPFDLIVDALGSRTPLAAPTGRTLDYGALWATLDWPANAGFDPHALEQRYRAASKMVGVLPTGTGAGPAHQAAFFWSLRGDAFAAWKAWGLDTWKMQVMSLWPACGPFLDQIDTPDRMTFARYTHRTLARPAEPALMHIGDAWHSASPQLGQGANMALLDAWAVAQGLREAGSSIDAAIVRAVALRRHHVALYQVFSALFTPVYQSDSRILPFVRDTIVGPLSKLWPATLIQAAMVSGLVGRPLKELGLD